VSEDEDQDMGRSDLAGNQELVTLRLSLRRPTQADIDAVHRIHSDPRACAHNPADALVHRADAEDLYRRWDRHWQQHGFGYWAIHNRTDPRPDGALGFCGIKVMQLHARRVLNLFYRLDPAAWGAGLATEAATAVVNWASTRLPDQPLIARVRPANTASLKVAARAGLRRAPHLDTTGADGLDWIFVSNWADDTEPAHHRRPDPDPPPID
jgi:[ribosomal protein S5]-alanine N-acetyltransferase